MIKPPFTILILKDSHHPVTIRITQLFVFLFILCIAVFVGTGISGIIFRFRGIGTDKAVSQHGASSYDSNYVLSEGTHDERDTSSESTVPEVRDLSIRQIRDGTIEITFTFNNVDTEKELYVWLIVNPEATDAGEKLIYPRSPIFRGLPVDYRNGIVYNVAEIKYLKTTFSGPVIGVDFNQLRILAYTTEGKISIDKLFNIRQKIRM
jgi:hypothetical protein